MSGPLFCTAGPELATTPKTRNVLLDEAGRRSQVLGRCAEGYFMLLDNLGLVGCSDIGMAQADRERQACRASSNLTDKRTSTPTAA